MTQERILIVEDEENERTGLAELVSGWGYRTDTAADGIKSSAGLPNLAKVMDRATVIRSHVLADLGAILHSRHITQGRVCPSRTGHFNQREDPTA